ncbi:DUF2254 domain-containing protein [Aequorivita echinoideorum]|uniref:DUF2254 domain-containing protein n=1 Tax=Aequorivita echinoideorum TaxID=1549647 RepID=A0ABS5S4R6_9FLAO|nr:DUF2254 family protein [Aequorivita echinoideorum]MBT0607362.1 DUF2254 domain-containing protein [Aequorivita echinoideorum]
MQTKVILKKISNSIALLPSGLALCFCLFAILLNVIDLGIENDGILKYFLITAKEDNQTIYSFIIGGIFTLTIFSYTMVMNVLNRNINNYSPRLIPLLLSEKHHQLILGVTSGTIIYAMIMAAAVSLDTNDSHPAIGACIGILFAIISVFLFIYFIHSISQSIHINKIFKDMYNRTLKNQKWVDKLNQKKGNEEEISTNETIEIFSQHCGYIQKPDFESLAKISKEHNLPIKLEIHLGEFVYRDQKLLSLGKKVSDKTLRRILKALPISNEVPMDLVETGIKHFVEVAVKASSPAINDPGTSRTAIEYLSQILIDYQPIPETIHINGGIVVTKPLQFETLQNWCFVEMDRYMHDDPLLVKVLENAKRNIARYRTQS